MELIILAILLGVGLYFGGQNEKNHYKSIRRRERKLVKIPVESGTFKEEIVNVQGMLVKGQVVIASDYFKTFASALRSITGGRLKNFETLLDRGRREAILRMKEEAVSLGADRIVNLKIETARIGNIHSGKNALNCVEVVAYGTALISK